MFSKQTIRDIFKFFFPLLFVCYWGGITLFTHPHVVNGVIVVHSHPFGEGHAHSKGGLETIFFLTHFDSPCQDVFFHPLMAGLSLLCVFLVPVLQAGVKPSTLQVISLRAPPSLRF